MHKVVVVAVEPLGLNVVNQESAGVSGVGSEAGVKVVLLDIRRYPGGLDWTQIEACDFSAGVSITDYAS